MQRGVFAGSRTVVSHYWILQNETWQYIENTHIYIDVYILSASSGSSGTFFFSLNCFLLLPHITPDIFLLLCSFSIQCLRGESPRVRGWQTEGDGPMWFCLGFAPYPMRGWFQGKKRGRMGSRALSPLQLLTRCVGTARGTSLPFICRWRMPASRYSPRADGAGRDAWQGPLAAGGLFVAMVCSWKHPPPP